MNPTATPQLVPPEPTTPLGGATRELRLALAMRGGVSLAVWIGGACAEIEALRLSAGGSGTPPVLLYAKLLEAAGYSGVTTDVLSGASAGGLNAALLSISLTYGVPFEQMKRLWLELADIRALLRDPGDPKPVSVLQGDEYFLARLEDKLNILIAESMRNNPAFPLPRSLDLHLAVTLLKPAGVVVYEDWATSYVEQTQRAAFHFRHNPYTSDFTDPVDERAPRPGIAHRLALAARSSSSFPGAFEPARVQVRRPAHIGERGGPSPEDMFGIISQGSPERMYVMDGGVLDNIPVERAIRSVATASAQGPTERWMLFLHPSPDESAAAVVEDGDERPTDQRPNALQTALRAFNTSASSESVLDDVAVLRQHNDAAVRYQMLQDALIGRLAQQHPALVITEAASQYHSYLDLRARFSAARIRQLLQDPVGVLGEDPFTDEGYRQPLGPLDSRQDDWPQERRAALEAALIRELREPPPWPLEGPLTQDIEKAHLLGVPPLMRIIDMLIGVVRQLERYSEHLALREVKGRLYAVRDVADLLNHMGDLFWPVYAYQRPPDPGKMQEWAEQAEAAREVFLRSIWQATSHLEPLPVEFPKLFDHLRQELLRRWKKVTALPWPDVIAWADGGPNVDLVRELWVRLVNCVLAVAAAAAAERGKIPARGPDVGSLRLFLDALGWIQDPESPARAEAERATEVVMVGDDQRAADQVEVALERAGAVAPPSTLPERAVQLLAAFEVLSFPLAMTALSGRQYIHLLRVAGTNLTPLQRLFPDGQLRVGDKLAGNELKNFAAFYKPSWRANDWMWGRLDAASSLLDLLVRPAAINGYYHPGASASRRAAGFMARVRRLVCARPPASAGLSPEQAVQWEDHFRELWAEHRDAVQAELDHFFHRRSGATLARTKEVLVARRHWELLLAELPDVVGEVAGSELAEGLSPRWQPRRPWAVGQRRRLKEESLMQAAFALKACGLDPLRQPEGMKKLLRHYRVGRETVLQEAGNDRFTRTGADLLVVAWNALTGGRKLGVLRPIGWGLRLLRLLALAVVQAPRWAVVLLLATIALGAYVAAEDKTWFVVNRPVATIAVLVAAAVLFYWSTFLWRGVIAVAIVAAVAGVAFNLSGQVSLRFGERQLLDRQIDQLAFLMVLVAAPLLWAAVATLRWRMKTAWRGRQRRSTAAAACSSQPAAPDPNADATRAPGG